ncbi:MAG TPA: MFS transporter [Xanthomonadales bacterium]|nr:MFS transporter [Xanthomonadales bacterium]
MRSFYFQDYFIQSSHHMTAHQTRPFFFGWWVVFAACVGMLFGSYSTFIGVTFALFVKPLEAAFGWSRTDISLALTLCTLVVVVLAPVVGNLIDRVGARRVLLISMGLLGFGMAGLSQLTGAIWQYYGLYIFIGVVGVGTIPTTFSRTLLNWFDCKRGLALGIALSGIGVAGIILPPLVQHLISALGWRETYLVIGTAALLLAWPVAFFLFRDHPSSMGLLPDGVEDDRLNVRPVLHSEPGLPFSEAARAREFWVILATIFFMGLGGTGVLIHFAALMTDRGMTPAAAALGFSMLGLAIILGRVACGYLVDKFFAPRIAVCFLLGPAMGVAMLALDSGTSSIYLAAVLIGLGLGAEFDLLSFLISRYLGLRAYGKVYGLMYSSFSVGAGIGPLLMGQSYDRLGAYTFGLWCLFTAICVAVIMVSRLGPYRYNIAHVSAPA